MAETYTSSICRVQYDEVQNVAALLQNAMWCSTMRDKYGKCVRCQVRIGGNSVALAWTSSARCELGWCQITAETFDSLVYTVWLRGEAEILKAVYFFMTCSSSRKV